MTLIACVGGLVKVLAPQRNDGETNALLWRVWRSFALMLLLFFMVLNTGAAFSQQAPEDEKRTGFFRYFPAVPDLKLPTLDIVPFWTDDLKKARKAYNKGEYAKALRLFRRESDDGNAVADWYLGHMHRLGRGVPIDNAVAFSYYQRVSESYDPDEPDQQRLKIIVDSQIQMANYQRKGIASAGMKADPARAARSYLRLASTYGHPEAHFALGVMTIKGEGVKQNPPQGLKWLTAAARKRHPAAQAYVGDLYWSGKYVKQDQVRALMWYTLAAETAKPSEDRAIIERYNEMRWSLAEDERLEAEARARVYSEQYPAHSSN